MTLRDQWRQLLPGRGDVTGMRENFGRDLLAGLTVAIVALPLALGFATAAGLDPAAGMITAILAGFMGAVFGGSALQVSGPTGAVTVVLIPVVAAHGPAAVLTLGLMAGLILVVIAMLRVGRFVRYVPAPVIEGFTIGIAVVIFLQQVPAALGTGADQYHVLIGAVEAVDRFAERPSWADAVMAVSVAAVILVGARWRPAIPFSLLAVAAATIVELSVGLDIVMIGELPQTLPAPSADFLDPTLVGALAMPALAVAALVSLESLLGAGVADRLSRRRDRHHPDRELFGQGVANLVVPLFGGMPASGAVTRTIVNTRSGARTRSAAAWHAVLLAVFMLAAAPLVSHVPLAALAGVLMATTIKMINVQALKAITRATRADGVVLVMTAVATVTVDLMGGVVIGLGLAAVSAVVKVAASLRLHIEAPRSHDHHDERAGRLAEHIQVFHLRGPLFFAAGKETLMRSCQSTTVSIVVLHLRGVTTIDATGALALCDFVDELRSRGIEVYMSGVRTEQHDTLTVLGLLDRVCTGDHLHGEAEEAVDAARRRLRAAGVL